MDLKETPSIISSNIELEFTNYINYLEFPKNIIKNYPKTIKLINKILIKFWNNWTASNNKLVIKSELKKEFLEFTMEQFVHQLLDNKELKEYATKYEKLKLKYVRGRKSLIKLAIESQIHDYLLVPNLIISAYEDPKGIVMGLKSSINKLKKEKLNNQQIIQHGKKFKGKKISHEKEELYKAIFIEQKELESKYRKSQKSSYKNATKAVCKQHPNSNPDKIYKAFMKYKKSHSRLF